MASFSGPKLSNRIADDVPAIQEILGSLAKLTPDSGNTDYPNGTKRVTETTNGYEFQQWNGSSWVHLEKWNINAQKVDGYSASTGTTASTIPVRGTDGKISGDITGNASTASTAAALSATNPIDKGGTGATTAEQARANLVVPPKNHASSSTEYGAGSSTQYGHLKSHDEPDATLTAATGHAFSPAGAASMKTELEEQIEEVETGASSQLSSLDASLRTLIAEEVAKYLPLAGGTLTGALYGEGGILRGVTDTGNIWIGGGTNSSTSSYIQLNSGGYTSLPGGITFQPANSNGRGNRLVLAVDSLKYNGFDVLTSAGGTMNGVIYNPTFMRNNLSGQIELLGGTTTSNGAYIALYGQSCTEGYGYGQLLLRGADKGTMCDLIVHPHNGVLINGQRVHTLAASWTSGANWYRKYSDGWIEQGGLIGARSGRDFAVTFHTAFTNTNYTLTYGSSTGSVGNGSQSDRIIWSSRTTTGFTFQRTDSNATYASWYACGY